MKKIKKYKFSSTINKEIRALLQLDNWHCWLALAEDVLVISLSIFMAYSISYYFYPLAVIIIGSRQRALATVLHEASHYTAAKNFYLNMLMGTFFSGYLIFQTLGSYRQSHVYKHHSRFGHNEKDPDYKYSIVEGLYNDDLTADIFFKKYILAPIFLKKAPSYLKSLLLRRLFNKEYKLESFIMLLWWSFIISLSVWSGFFHLIILFWLIPYLTSFQVVGWFIELAEHFPLMRNDVTLYMSRNRHSYGIEKFLTSMHNENYHLIHHLTPTIPFWNMKKAHEIYMKDSNYAEWNQQTEGIFFSKTTKPSIIKHMLDEVQQYFVSKVKPLTENK